MLTHKSRVVGENPCNVDKIFRKMKMHGGYNRQGSGVNAIENALWDLAGKAYDVPIYQMLGGKFRERIRMYTEGAVRSNDPKEIGAAYKARVEAGFTMVKYDLNVAENSRRHAGHDICPGRISGGTGGGP